MYTYGSRFQNRFFFSKHGVDSKDFDDDDDDRHHHHHHQRFGMVMMVIRDLT